MDPIATATVRALFLLAYSEKIAAMPPAQQERFATIVAYPAPYIQEVAGLLCRDGYITPMQYHQLVTRYAAWAVGNLL